ncbi:MAG: magnesium transporter CorA family protein [Chloroflexi bacterium]|nr:magnesium transporter CorA family protein [Chloroflexota bacterium]
MTVSQEKKKGQSLHLESLTWGDLTWVNIEQPTERETGYLAQNYPFHPLDLDDCLSLRQRPKLDVYKDYLFFIFPFSVWDKMTRVSRHDQVSVFVGEKYLITVHSGQLRTLVALFHQCQIDEEVCQQNLGSGSGYLLYRILDRTVDSYFPILNSILAWIEEVEDRVFDENVEAVKEVAVLRRDIVTQRRILHSLRVVTAELESKSKRFCKIDISVQFGDLMDHLNKICDSLDEAREVVEIFKDTDYILSTDRLNRIIRVLTIFGSILLPFLMVSSIYGMNIPLPGGPEQGSLLGFLILMAIMLLASGSMLYFFRRRHWT